MRDVEGDVGGERGLAHAGTAREHDQVRGCRPPMSGRGRAGRWRCPRGARRAWIGGVGHVDGGLHRIGEAFEAAVVAAGFGQLEQTPLGVLDLRLRRRHVDRRVIGGVDHVLADGISARRVARS
jgi:hypothetical protein